MKQCIGCGQDDVDPEDSPRYDVFHPDYEPSQPMSNVGPYCASCWAITPTGQLVESLTPQGE